MQKVNVRALIKVLISVAQRILSALFISIKIKDNINKIRFSKVCEYPKY